jgi:hypothetical protein
VSGDEVVMAAAGSCSMSKMVVLWSCAMMSCDLMLGKCLEVVSVKEVNEGRRKTYLFDVEDQSFEVN